VKNIGFAAGHNKLFAANAAPYVLCLNQDTVLQPDYIMQLAAFLDAHPSVGSVSGKLVRETGDIDSAGISLGRFGAVADIGSEQSDRGQYDGERAVFGVSGAAVMYRRASVDDVSVDGTLFDDTFISYKEDVDLAWRLQLRGWESYVIGAAVSVHVRGVKGGAPLRLKGADRQRLSTANHLRMLTKNLAAPELIRFGVFIAVYEVMKAGYLLIRQPAALMGYADFFHRLPDTLEKRKVVQTQKTHSITGWFGRT